MAEIEAYKIDYDEFVAGYKKGQTDAEEVGFRIVKMVQYFSDMTLRLAVADDAFNKKAAEIIQSVDEDSGKAISAAKAERLAEALPESLERNITKAHVLNLEQTINGLKSLQRGLLNEYSYSGNT